MYKSVNFDAFFVIWLIKKEISKKGKIKKRKSSG